MQLESKIASAVLAALMMVSGAARAADGDAKVCHFGKGSYSINALIPLGTPKIPQSIGGDNIVNTWWLLCVDATDPGPNWTVCKMDNNGKCHPV